MTGPDYSNVVHFAWEPCPTKSSTGLHAWNYFEQPFSHKTTPVVCRLCGLWARFSRLELDKYEVLWEARASAHAREPKSGRK